MSLPAGTKAYFFRSNSYVRYDRDDDKVDAGWPKLIADEWQGMAAVGFASGLDAAVNWGNGKAYFFKGGKYLRYDIAGDKVDAGWPKLIADEWQGMAAAGFASGLDAVVNWGNGKAYFFKGNKYLRYDIAGDKVDAGWPKLIANEWRGMATAGFGAGLDAAIILVGSVSFQAREDQVKNAINGSTVLARGALAKIQQLMLLTQLGQFALSAIKASPDDFRTLQALERWLKVTFASNPNFFNVKLKELAALIEANANLSSRGKILLEHEGACAKADVIAAAVLGDAFGTIICCPEFFDEGPQCQRNVVLHERFHHIGVGDGRLAANGQPIPPTSADDTLTSAHHLTDLIKDVMGQPMEACGKGL